MEKLVATGKTKAIGISNFSRAETEQSAKEASIVPAAHQIECHVGDNRLFVFPRPISAMCPCISLSVCSYS